MKIAYLVFAYKNPALLQRVVRKLSTRDSAFFIHIDQKSNIDQFSQIRGENIFFTTKRIPVYWAEFTGIEAILILMQEALATDQRYEYMVLLSGSDYPLRSAGYIEKFFSDNRGGEFISLVKVPAPGKPLSRMNTLRFPSTKPVRRFLMRALAKVGLATRDYRRHLPGLEAYSGNTWWALSRAACQYIVEFHRKNPHVADFFRNMFAPEEAFFHTILGNSPLRLHVKRNVLFEDWSAEGAHPEMIGENHLAFFESLDRVSVNDAFGDGELLFARKFSDESLIPLQRIDEMIERKEHTLSVTHS